MGISIDNAYKKWRKEPQVLYRPKIEDKISIDYDTDEYTYHNLLSSSKCECLRYMGKYINPYFNQEYFEYYLKQSNKYIDIIQNMPESELKMWFLKHKGKMIFADYDYFYVASEIEEYIVNRWTGYDRIHFHEDGKLLYNAIGNLEYLYGLNLYDAIIDYDSLREYDEEDKSSEYVDNKLTKDISYLLNDIDNYFRNVVKRNVVKRNDDQFFDDRNERLKIIRDIIKQGGRMVYSV